MKKYLYAFDEGNKSYKPLLGGKGANLAEMTQIGLPVPAGFTITTEACNDYFAAENNLSEEMITAIHQHLSQLEQKTGKRFADSANPLLVSVRSGAVISMPGMMDTVLNLGLNDETVEGLARLTGDARFAYDSYRRFIQMYGDVVMGIPKFEFDRILEKLKQNVGVENDTDLTVDHLKQLIEQYNSHIEKTHVESFPKKPIDQLIRAIKAVFDSWNNARAKVYRQLNDIDDKLGTAVNIQSMVFGNMGDSSGTGVAFTRNPSTGENVLFGEFLLNAQGEDVVAGIRTPKAIADMEQLLPDVYRQFVEVTETLENHFSDMQDIEFTIEQGKLFLLQTRTAKRTAQAAVQIAVDMVDEGLIDQDTALLRIEPAQLDQLLHRNFDSAALEKISPIAKGLPASPGAATGKIVFHSSDVLKAKEAGQAAILVRMETSPEDIEGMVHAAGILTARGGMTSHAAVVARGMGKCCVAGCGEINVDETLKQFTVDGEIYREGDYLSLDGNTGAVYHGEIATVEPAVSGNFDRLMRWADQARTLAIRTNADNPKDAKVAVNFGAEGIGLCRTEHMFFDEARIFAVRQMILAESAKARITALDKLLPYQREDFVGIFEVMAGRPVTVRLLDPPLHEFLPHEEQDIADLAKELGTSVLRLKDKINELAEFNPMLGHRGCRLAISYPEIYQMQIQAIFEALVICKKEKSLDVKPEIMIPLVGHRREFEILKALVDETAQQICQQAGVDIDYLVGTMIEVPRAALIADEIAELAQFFSFGTNDLTQMTLGFSRDDAGKFIGEYRNKEIFEKDPFERIDIKGVGKLIELAVEKGREARPDIKLGICGEHGGEPHSIAFCHSIGLDYVSCSPYRVPIARLAAAQAALREDVHQI